MPAWEDRLTEEQIWQVIMYLYEATGQQPRVWTRTHCARPGPGRRRPVARHGLARAAAGRRAAADAAPARPSTTKCCAGAMADGKGDGPAAELLVPRPRDFTAGVYKIRTTSTRTLASDQDLFRIITDGMPGTSMPAWKVLPEKDRGDLVAYIKTFAATSYKERQARAVPPEGRLRPRRRRSSGARRCSRRSSATSATVSAGRADRPSRSELKDDWGHPIPPANLHQARGRSAAARTARTIATRLADRRARHADARSFLDEPSRSPRRTSGT